MNYQVLAFYELVPIEEPAAEVKKQKKFFADTDMTGRIYIAKEGINAQLSGTEQEVADYLAWMRGDDRFSKTIYKVQDHHENAFPRMTVKVREELVAMGQPVDLSKRGDHLPPKEWAEMLASGEAVVVDVRNDYEWDVGRFEGAERPNCNTFREFPAAADKFAAIHDKKTKVIMYCTGGIRCEFFSPLLKERGFDEVYQLEGGVIKYGEEVGGDHWKGKLFVFDDRLGVDMGSDEVVGRCHTCHLPADEIYNCANMDCNELFISCSSCLEGHQGCCQTACTTGDRVRPYDHQLGKPFRKWYNYLPSK